MKCYANLGVFPSSCGHWCLYFYGLNEIYANICVKGLCDRNHLLFVIKGFALWVSAVHHGERNETFGWSSNVFIYVCYQRKYINIYIVRHKHT